MPDKNKKKQLKRKFISLEDKIKILNRLKDGERHTSVAKSLNLNEATIRTIKKNECKIRKSVVEGCSVSAKRVARARDIDIIKMENALMIWLEDCVNKKIPLSGHIIRHKAVKIYKHLKEIGNYSGKQHKQSFTASKGWFEKLKKRFSLHNFKFQGEQTSADADAAHKLTLEVREMIDKREYTTDQIFKADETALYWKKMPSRTYILQNVKCAPGFKTCKDSVTLPMCSNLSGNCMLKPMVTHCSFSPRTMKIQGKSQLSVYKRSNRKARTTKTMLYADQKDLLQHMVQKENAVQSPDVQYNRILDTASRLEGEGLANMNIKDMEESFQEQTLSEEELMKLIIEPFFNSVNMCFFWHGDICYRTIFPL